MSFGLDDGYKVPPPLVVFGEEVFEVGHGCRYWLCGFQRPPEEQRSGNWIVVIGLDRHEPKGPIQRDRFGH